MNNRDAMAIAREFHRLHKAADDLDRRMASTLLSGKVAEIDGDRIRLELQPVDGRTGKRFLSPWVQVQEAAGQTGTHFPVKKGDPMRLLSSNGELGPQSLAIRDGYTADAQNPSEKKQGEMVIAHDGPVRIRGSKIVLEGETHLGGEGGKEVHRIGDRDSDGDTATTGASRVYAL